MGVDYFWKRVSESALDGAGPGALAEMVPHWFDDEFAEQVSAERLVGAEDTGALIVALLRSGAPADPAADLFARPPADWDEDWMVGTLPPATVRSIAELFARAPLESWARQGAAELAAEVRRVGYRRPFDDAWAAQALSDARDVGTLFRAAAAEREAVIFKVSA